MNSITIKNGIDYTLTTSVEQGTTLGDIRRNSGYQAALRFSGNDIARVNSYSQGDEYVLRNGDVVSFEKAAGTKAAR